MNFDIPTLYALTVGTLCVAAAMTAWESRAAGRRSDVLVRWAAGYAILATGCLVMGLRGIVPFGLGPMASNIVILAGYVVVLWGVTRFVGEPAPRWCIPVVGMTALAWLAVGNTYVGPFWHHVSSAPIALICGATAWLIWHSKGSVDLRSRWLAAGVSAGHALFYLARAVAMPPLVMLFGNDLLMAVAVLTMFEAVLYAVAMPMTLLALVREEAEGKLLIASQTDFLTGLGNRQAFFQRGAALLAESDDDRPAALLAFDLDHFKSINDRYGHAAGDDVLRLFARILGETAEEQAIPVRLGGEEFAVLVPGFGAREGLKLAESIRQRFACEAARIDVAGGRATVSIGVAEFAPRHKDLSALLSEADAALYRAKQFGRNRVEISAPGSEPIRLLARPA